MQARFGDKQIRRAGHVEFAAGKIGGIAVFPR
jgi:hypothetical protein